MLSLFFGGLPRGTCLLVLRAECIMLDLRKFGLVEMAREYGLRFEMRLVVT
jgi:hypothetical protein